MRLKLFFALAVVSGLSFSQLKAQQTAKITSSGIGFLEYLPDGYKTNNNDYPIVIFLHGIGEKGTTSTDPTTLLNSVWKVANVGLPKYIKYGAKYPFLMIAPQLKSSYGLWPANYVMDVLNYVKKYLRIDERRIYITGLSLGGYGTWTTLGAYPEVFAASVPICSGGNVLSKACAIAAENIPIWAFHGTADDVVSYTVTTKMIDAINACTPKPNPLAKYTLFSGVNHNAWDKTYKETNALTWMLSFTNGSSTPTTTANVAPVANAGADRATSSTSISVAGSGTDKDGRIVSYQWIKYDGADVTLTNANSPTVTVSGMKDGKYFLRLTVTDDKGATDYDNMQIAVSGSGSSSGSTTTNIAPVANAGSDKRISSTSIALYGSGSDKDGKIASYKWIQYGGTAATLTNASSPTLNISGLRDGNYYFRLTVTDDRGASDSDNVLVAVSNSSTASTSPTAPNIAPVANAGSDKQITTTSTILYGSGTDKDGKIVSYKWIQYGGAAATLSNASSPNLSVSGLRNGKYYFRLTVTDDRGATDYDNTLVSVSNTSTAANLSPAANAGPDKRITDALNSLKVYGSASDRDGKIVSYKWVQYGGDPLTLTNPQSPAVTVSGLDPGKYYLKLTVKDDDGATDYDRMLIVVNES
jgi:poly(3-hydroxybutyrate) depolymerase